VCSREMMVTGPAGLRSRGSRSLPPAVTNKASASGIIRRCRAAATDNADLMPADGDALKIP
jgi:hypothetical protein